MNLFDLLDFINFIINKEQSGKHIDPQQFTLLLKRANYKFFKKYFGVPEEYRPGMAMASIQWEITDTIKDKLSKFMVSMDDDGGNPMVLTNGRAAKPADYFFRDYFSTTTGTGRFLKGYQFSNSLKNSVTFPTEKNPIGKLEGDQFVFAPNTLNKVNFYYLRRPLDPFFDSYLDEDDNMVYLAPGETSPGTAIPPNKLSESIELEWDQDCLHDIVEYILQDIGVGINRNDIAQYAQQNKTLGV